MESRAAFYGGATTVGAVLRRVRCSGGCGALTGAASLPEPVLNPRATAAYAAARAGGAGVAARWFAAAAASASARCLTWAASASKFTRSSRLLSESANWRQCSAVRASLSASVIARP